MRNIKSFLGLVPLAMALLVLAGCPGKSNPTTPNNPPAPTDTPPVTSTPFGTPLTGTPTVTPTGTLTCGSPQTIGLATIGSTGFTFTAVAPGSSFVANQLHLATPANFTHFYISATGGYVEMGLYTDTGNQPGNLIAETGFQTISGSWTSYPVTIGPVPAGNYWIAAISTSSFTVQYTPGPANSCVYGPVTTVGSALPNTYPGGGFVSGQSFSMYAIYCPILGTPPPTFTPVPPDTSTPTSTPSATLSPTITDSATVTPTDTPPQTPTPTLSSTATSTFTPSPTLTNTQTATSTPTNSLSAFVTLGSGTYFAQPAGIAYSNSHLWVLDYVNLNLQEWATNGSAPVTTVSSFATTAFGMPWGVGTDPHTGNVYVADGNYGPLASMQSEVFDPSGNFLYAFGNAQLGGGIIADPTGVGVNAAGTTVYVMGERTNRGYIFSISGTSPNQTYTYQTAFGGGGAAPQVLNNPHNMHVDGSGNIWVACFGDSSIKEYSPSGVFENNFTAPELVNVEDVAVANGNIYAVDGSGLVLIFNSSGSVIGQFGAGTLGTPEGITTDGAGNFYVTDPNYQCIFGFH